MPKKPPKNGYYYFMLDFKRREEKNGRRFLGGMKEVADAAASEWKTLAEPERDDYNRFAKENRHLEERQNIKKSMEKKYNSAGVSFAQLEKEKEEKERKVKETEMFISDFIRMLDITLIKTKQMFLIHVNIFCKTDTKNPEYYPCELAISKFSMADGIIDTYHTFINPGRIKTGYTLAVREHSEKFHKITLEDVNNPEYDKSKIYEDLKEFLKDHYSVPLFTMYDDVFQNTSFAAVEKTLEFLCSNGVNPDPDSWKKYYPVYPLPLLFHGLKNKCYEVKGYEGVAFPNTSLAIIELCKDSYNFKIDHACKFHQNQDAVAFCSLSYVKRWVQIIRDHCCVPLDIDFNDETEIFETDFRSSMSTYGDDAFTDCKSEISDKCIKSSTSSMETVTDASVSFASASKRYGTEGSSRSEAAGTSKSGFLVWSGKSSSTDPARMPTLYKDNFPALGDIGRGVHRLNVNDTNKQ